MSNEVLVNGQVLGHFSPDGTTIHEPDSFNVMRHMTSSMDRFFEVKTSGDLRLFFGIDPGQAAQTEYALCLEQVVREPAPIPPRKGAWGVGKQYRAARRHYQRRVKAWKRRGGTVKIKEYIPRATVEAGPDGSFIIQVVS